MTTVPNATNTTGTNSTNAASSAQTLAGNFDTFLTLLTSQLQNQDPLSPMDSTQFTQQLVQFSQVEQQIKTNQNLESLSTTYQQASASAAVGYLGRDAIVESDTTGLANGSAAWTYSLPSAAQSATLEIRDASNRTVYSTDAEIGSGSHDFTWNGRNNNGSVMPNGNYHMVISATKADGSTITPTYYTRQTIQGIDYSQTTPQFITPTGSYSIDQLRAVLD